MKNIIIISAFVALLFASCKDEETTTPKVEDTGLQVENKQRSTLIYYTATWCGPCGSYGSPIFKSILESNSNTDLTAIDIHTNNSQLVPIYRNSANDSFYYSPVLGILGNLPLPGTIPAFFLNGNYEGATNVSSSKIGEKLKAYNATEPIVGVAAKAVKTGSNINITTRAKFFKEAEGKFYLSVLVIENEIDFRQLVGSAYQESFMHKHIIKASARDGKMDSQNLYGNEPIASGTVAVNTVIDGTYTFEHRNDGTPNKNYPEWNFDGTNTSIAVLVWKDKTDGTKEVVNSIMVNVE